MKSLEGVPKRGDEGEENKQLQERGRACTDDANCQGPRSGWSFHLKLTHTHAHRHTDTQRHTHPRSHSSAVENRNKRRVGENKVLSGSCGAR